MEMSKPSFTSTSYLKSLSLIYLVILISMLVFSGVIVFITESWETTMPASDDLFLVIVPLVTFLGVILGRVMYKKMLDNLNANESLKNKLIGYRTAFLIKLILAEFPFVIGVVGTLVTGNIFYLMISGTLVMYFITLKPSRSKIKKDLNLSTAMGLQFNERNTIIN